MKSSLSRVSQRLWESNAALSCSPAERAVQGGAGCPGRGPQPGRPPSQTRPDAAVGAVQSFSFLCVCFFFQRQKMWKGKEYETKKAYYYLNKRVIGWAEVSEML